MQFPHLPRKKRVEAKNPNHGILITPYRQLFGADLLASCDVLDERAGAGSVRLCMTTIYQQCLNPVAASFYGMSKQQIFEKLLNTDLRELCEYVRRLFVVQSILIHLSTLQSEMSVGPFYVT